MNTCKFCGESSPNMINDICIDCLADKLDEIGEVSFEILKSGMQSSIKFVDLRASDIGWEFALFNIKMNRFITIYDKSAWNCFSDLMTDVRSEVKDFCQDPEDAIKFYAKQCPDWVIP